MARFSHKIIGSLVLAALLVSLSAVAYDYCTDSPLLNPRCSLCELKNILNGAFKKNVESATIVLPTDYWSSVLVSLSPTALCFAEGSPSFSRLPASPKNCRAPPASS
ncbi:MAG TPA: hypothetical protein VLD40_05955 [Dissulfurispiraceae bacterium]|nr:hypothetical protein [Dissulfurispiraceae bacterium]